MPYLGNQPSSGGYHKLDNLTASATDTYALTLGGSAYYPATANQLMVSLNGVIQAPQDSFTISGSNIVFASTLSASDSIDFIMSFGDVYGIGTPADGTITDAKIQSMAASKLTGALPAIDGSALTGVSAGKVLQVVHSFYDTEESLTQSANTPQATGLTATITPTDATSKILVTYSLCTSSNNSGAAFGSYHMVYHDIGQTGTDTAFSSRFFGARFGQYSNYQMTNIGGQVYHDHNTTSAIDYTVYIDNNNAATIYINRGGSSDTGLDGASSITLMEIEQ